MKSEQENYYLPLGTVLHDKYIVGRFMGCDSIGVNYIAWDTVREQRVVIKECFPHGRAVRKPGSAHLTVVKYEPWFKIMRDFLDVARKLAKFQNESGVHAIYDGFEENNTAYIVMEYLEGITLKEYIKNTDIMPEQTAIQLLMPIMKSLKSLHSDGIIHREIEPKNIFMSSNGNIKLINFSSAKFYDNDTRGFNLALGYSPVEQYGSVNKQGPWSDVYALGATMYRMVTGVRPEESIERKEHDTLAPPKELNPSLSQEFSKVIMKAMAVDKRHRFKTVKKLEEALEAIL